MFELHSAIHPAPRCGKNNADLIFVVGMQHIQRYVREQMRDFYCPIHVIKALEYDGGLVKSY